MSDSKLKDALSKLDVTNDNHWTQDGLPRLDTLKFMSGIPDVTREMVTSAAPGLMRNNAGITLSDTPIDQVAPSAAGNGTGIDEMVSLAPIPLVKTNSSVDVDALQKQWDDLNLTYNDALTTMGNAKNDVAQIQSEMDAIVDILAEARKEDSSDAIGGYLASQRQELQNRADRQAALVGSGVDFKALLGGLVAPIDAALAAKRKK